jgi:transposase
MDSQQSSKKFSPEVRERAVRMVFDHQGKYASQWAAMVSIGAKIGCNAETLRHWARRAECDAGARPGLTSDERARWSARTASCGRPTRSWRPRPP